MSIEQVKLLINRVSESLEASDMGEVEEHLLTLQHQLNTTPHLVDMLLPEDIGVLVTAERKRMKQDILLQSLPSTRKKSTAKKKPSAKSKLDLSKVKLDLSDW